MKRERVVLSVVMVVAFAIAVACYAINLNAQSSLTLQPGSTLSACPTPTSGSKSLIFCNVAGDSANPDGVYVSANGAAYFRVTTGSVAILPQTVTAVTGTCITGYSAATGLFTTGACLGALTKAEVLGTGVTATTTLQ